MPLETTTLADSTSDRERQHIVSTPGTSGGKPRVDGTRIRVQDVVVWTEQGRSPEEIVNDYSQLTLADVYAALTYYHDHRIEIDRQMKDGEELAARLQADPALRNPRRPTTGTHGTSVSP